MPKRAFDIVFSLLGLLVLSPLFLLTSFLIKLDSSGPVFFKQNRVGKGGKLFKIIKFRTMITGAEHKGPKLTMRHDPRITNIGQILRWLKIDEFPQLINILTGEMSFVGPRPEIPSIVTRYTAEQRGTLSVKPGITGPGQISGRDEVSKYPEGVDTEEFYIKFILPEKLKGDLEYAKGASFAKDLSFIIRTLFITFVKSIKLEYVFHNRKRLQTFGLDIIVLLLSYLSAFLIRFEGFMDERYLNFFLSTLPILIFCRIGAFLFFGLYRGIGEYTGFYDIMNIFRATTIGSLLFVLVIFLFDYREHSRSIFFIDWALVTFFIIATRIRDKLFKRIKTEDQLNASRLLIIGAGDNGERLARDMERMPDKYKIVGFLDDSPEKLHLTIHGIPILGKLENLPQVVKLESVNEVLVAIPSLHREKTRQIINTCKSLDIRASVIPTVGETMDRISRLDKIRPIQIEDLLGRKGVELDFTQIKNFIKGKRVLVSGASGSIGSELTRQIAPFEPEELILFDRNENTMFFLEMELAEEYPSLRMSPIIGDITDERRADEVFQQYRPHIVFHAAAHKHVPMMEKNPGEAIKNNILGTKNMADNASAHGVEKFVLVSTDKAVNPVSIMGMTKRIAEIYVHSLAEKSRTLFSVVRFGNVLGSEGSVIPIFLRQIRKGGPVKVTHPDMVRYFMTIYEAAQLVIQAGAMGKGGEIFLLDMGEPVKIVDLARDIIVHSGLEPGKDVEIVFEGKRPGEKLYEELYRNSKELLETEHGKILRVKTLSSTHSVISVKISRIIDLLNKGNISDWPETLKRAIPEYERHSVA